MLFLRLDVQRSERAEFQMVSCMKSGHFTWRFPASLRIRVLLKAAIGVLATGVSIWAAPGAPVSDEFNSTVLNTSLWTLTNPAGGTFSLNGTNLLLSVPGGATHDPTVSGSDNAVRMMQTIANVDFDVIVKFDSIPSAQYTN
ncbi:MAG: putative Fibronectin type protein [Bryobacterales bacterium]|nr:putative Fibronectin type protein [Bryobacterales bacterium]